MNYLSNLITKYYGRIILAICTMFLVIIGLVACQDTDGGPLGPSSIANAPSTIKVSPSSVTLTKVTGTQTFTAIGGSGTFTWSVDNAALGSIVSDTGVFTAGNGSGNLLVRATDTSGRTATANVNVGNKTLTITPRTATVGRSLTQVFTVTGGTGTVFFSVDKTTFGNFPATTPADATGTFTASKTLGSATVTATDEDGDTVTASIEVVANQITVAPAAAAFDLAAQTVNFTPAGGVGTFYSYTLSGATGTYDVDDATDVTLIPDATGTFAVFTIVALPTAAEGNQNLVLTVTDGNGDTGTVSIFIEATAI